MRVTVAERGFTLIELMVTLVIVGILAGIAWPSYTDWQKRGRLDTDIRKVKSALQRMRSRSVQEGIYQGTVPAPTNSYDCHRLYFGLIADPGWDYVYRAYYCERDDSGGVLDFDVAPNTGEDELVAIKPKIELKDGVTVGSGQTLQGTPDTPGNYILFAKDGSVFGNPGTIELVAGNRSRAVTIGDGGRIRDND